MKQGSFFGGGVAWGLELHKILPESVAPIDT